MITIEVPRSSRALLAPAEAAPLESLDAALRSDAEAVAIVVSATQDSTARCESLADLWQERGRFFGQLTRRIDRAQVPWTFLGCGDLSDLLLELMAACDRRLWQSPGGELSLTAPWLRAYEFHFLAAARCSSSLRRWERVSIEEAASDELLSYVPVAPPLGASLPRLPLSPELRPRERSRRGGAGGKALHRAADGSAAATGRGLQVMGGQPLFCRQPTEAALLDFVSRLAERGVPIVLSAEQASGLTPSLNALQNLFRERDQMAVWRQRISWFVGPGTSPSY